MFLSKIINFFLKKNNQEDVFVGYSNEDYYHDYLIEYERLAKQKKTYEFNFENGLKNLYNNKKRKMFFDFIPKNQSYKNVRSFLEFATGDFKTWKKIRDGCEKTYNNKCAYCNKQNDDVFANTECHEIFSFKYNNKKQVFIQKLEFLISVCTECHKIKHLDKTYGIDIHKNNFDDTFNLLNKYAEINKIEFVEAKNELDIHYKLLSENNNYYIFDFSKLIYYFKKYNIRHNFKVEDLIFDCNAEKFETFLRKFKRKNIQADD